MLFRHTVSMYRNIIAFPTLEHMSSDVTRLYFTGSRTTWLQLNSRKQKPPKSISEFYYKLIGERYLHDMLDNEAIAY